MLILKPNCECCDKDLPAESTEAMICSYEFTFCANCVTNLLKNVCPNCGGGFSSRPIRPLKAYRKDTNRVHSPASTTRVNTKYLQHEIEAFVASIKDIPADKR